MVKVYYGSLQTQSSSTSAVTQSRVSGFQSLISAFSDFSSSSGELNGQGYDAARAYATGIMIPYYQACILYSEGVADAANTLADDYSAKCGSEDLDEEKLRAEIESASRGCMALSASISGIRSKSKPTEGDSERISRLESQLAAAEARIRETQEKLDNLLEFSSQSQMACTSANSYWLAVSQGLRGVSASFSGGGFAFPSDVSWVSVVEQGWAEREINLSNAYTAAMEKVYNGEDLTETDLSAIERYAIAYPDYVDSSVLAYVKEVRAVKAEEMKYRNLINKEEINGSLSDEEIQMLKEYEQKYPDGILLEQVREVLAGVKGKKNVEKPKQEEISSVESTIVYFLVDAYNRGLVTPENAHHVFNYLKSPDKSLEKMGVPKVVIDFAKESFTSHIQDKLSDSSAEYLISRILPYSPILANQLSQYIGKGFAEVSINALLATTPGSTMNSLFGKGIDTIADFVVPVANSVDDLGKAAGGLAANAKFAKALPYGIGSALDLGVQLYQGEEVGDALVKTGAHTAIGIGGAKLGAAIGTVGGPVTMAIGAGLGFGISVVGSMAFDALYDNREEIGKWVGKSIDSTKEIIEETWNKAGDAVSGFFSGLGNAFGF